MEKPNQIFLQFVGTWKLVECVETNMHGETIYPWGRDAIGYLIYTKESVMAVQIMRKSRKLFTGKDITQATAQEGQELVKDYNAYFGSFEIDETNKTVIHIVQGHLNPNMVGQKNVRAYNFYDTKLSLITQGGTSSKKLIWQKVTV